MTTRLRAIALIVVIAAGLWFVVVAFLMALRPRYCLHLIEKMTAGLERSNWVATSLLIIAAPIRCHGVYGGWWVKFITPLVLRILSAVPAAAGVGLIYAAL